MENRITDIGPQHYSKFLPPVIARNKGKWLWHEIIEPGILMHKAESEDEIIEIYIVSGDRKGAIHKLADIIETKT